MWVAQAQKCSVSQFRPRKSKMKALASLVPSEGWEGRLAPASPLASGSLLAIFNIPWLAGVNTQTSASFTHAVLPVCVPVSEFPLFISKTVILD